MGIAKAIDKTYAGSVFIINIVNPDTFNEFGQVPLLEMKSTFVSQQEHILLLNA